VDRGNARSSPHLSVIALGCLCGRGERGVGQGHYPCKCECEDEHEHFQGMDKS
jgi:hypothetical protein